MAKDFKSLIKGSGKKDDLISHLIRGTTQKDEEFTLTWLPHDKVYSVTQARKKFINIEALASTMNGRRQNQAITVYPADEDGRHQIKTGERRWRAAVLNNEPVLATILNRQKKIIDAKQKFDQIVENDQREPLTPLEMAKELGDLRAQFNLKPGQIAEGIGRPAAYVSKHLKLLEMPEEVQNLREDGVVTYIETLNILTSVFALSEDAGLELADEARKKGELSRSEAQEFLKALKSRNDGGQQPDNSGTQLPDNNGSQLTDNNGSQLPDNNCSQLPDNNDSQLPDNNGSQLPDNNSSQLPDNNGAQEQTKQTKINVTFYVTIDDSVFELVDKPSFTENGEVYVFCREREGMPEMQVPIDECTLHHASLTK